MRSIAIAASLLLLFAAGTAEAGGKPEHKITQSESFIMIEPMYTSILDAGRPAGMLLVAIGLDIPDAELRGEADRGMPVLRDEYVRSLMSFTAAAVRPWRQPDVGMIADRLQRVTDAMLHRKGARVLLAQVAIQPKH